MRRLLRAVPALLLCTAALAAADVPTARPALGVGALGAARATP